MADEILEVKYNERLLSEVAVNSKFSNNVLGIVLATKPCFYKLWSVINEAKKQGLPYIVINSGQHYDNLVGYGVKEFDLEKEVAIDIQLRGDLSQKSAEIFLKAKQIHSKLKELNKDLNLVPYVNGDTLTAGLLPAAWMFASNQRCIQGEAGLRGMSPSSFIGLKKEISTEKLISSQLESDWVTNRSEPFPEQYDTYTSAAGCEYFFAPVKLNAEYLIREGYTPERIFTVGNTVVDAVKLKKTQKPQESIFAQYPALESGEWIRFDIHRRDNLTKQRFMSIIHSIISLAESGKKICMVELTATAKAIDYYSLRERLTKLSSTHKNFLFTPLWKEYSQVMEFTNSPHCSLIVTDSGSMQEEMNELNKPCLTVRFNTDRPETVFEGKTNLLAPPLTDKILIDLVNYVVDHDYFARVKDSKKLYGNEVGKKIVKQVSQIFQERPAMFSWAHEELKIYKEKDSTINYL